MSLESETPGLSAETSRSTARRDLLLSIGGFVVIAAAAVGLLVTLNSTSRQPLLPAAASPMAERPIELTLVHTNDTWGYVEPCG